MPWETVSWGEVWVRKQGQLASLHIWHSCKQGGSWFMAPQQWVKYLGHRDIGSGPSWPTTVRHHFDSYYVTDDACKVTGFYEVISKGKLEFVRYLELHPALAPSLSNTPISSHAWHRPSHTPAHVRPRDMQLNPVRLTLEKHFFSTSPSHAHGSRRWSCFNH